MSNLRKLIRDTQKAQAEAIRNAGSLEEAVSTQTYMKGNAIMQRNLQQEEAARLAAQQKAENEKKAAATISAYDAYQGSEEQRKNRAALEEAMKSLFPATGAKVPEFLLQKADTREQELKAAADYYKNQQRAETDRAIMEADLKEYESWSDADKAAMEQYIIERDRAQSNIFGEPQFDTYNLSPIVQSKGIAKVRQMANSLQRSRNEKTAELVTAAAEKAAAESPVLGSALSVGANLLGSYTGPMEYVKEMANRDSRYTTLDPNNLGSVFSQYGGTVRQGVSQKIEGEDGSWLRKVAAIGYEGVMSAADSAARMAAGGFDSGVSSVIAASGSFGNSLRQYSAQGASPEQAAAAALATSGIEYITEKIPMDELLKVKDSKSAVKAILKQALGVEPTTEEISLFANVAAETVILGEKSDRSQRIGELIANGASYEEATEQVNKELWKEAAKTYAVSAVSGGFSAGGAAIIGGNTQTQGEKNAAPGAAETVLEQQPGAAPVTTSKQETMDAVVGSYMPNIPKDEPVQLTEGQRQLEAAIRETLGMEPETAQKNTATDGGESGGLRGYTQHERDNWKSSKRIVLFEGAEQFRQFIRNALSGNTQTNKKLYFGAITSDLAAKISDSTGLNVDGYNLSLGENEIRKINKRHGNEAAESSRGQRAVTEDDYLKIPEVVKSADLIKRSDEDYAGKPVVEFYKRNGNEVTTVVAVVSDKHLDVFVQTSYINKKTGSIATPESATPTPLTSETTGGTAPMNSIPETGAEVKGTGAAEANFSGKAAYQDLLYEDNVQRDREGDVRPVEVPKTDSYGRNVSEFVGNAYGAEITPDSMASEIENLVQEGALGYDRRSNQDALNDAAKEIEEKGAANVRSQITRAVADGKIRDGDIEKAMLLYASYANKKGQTAQDNASELFIDLTTMAHMSGRNLQLFGLLRKLTPEGQASTIQKMVQRNVENMVRSGQVKKGYSTEVAPELLNEYRDAAKENMRAVSDEQKQQSAEKMQQIQQAIFATEAAKMPSTFKAKWDAWRYMAMLGNAKTQVRNIAGNALFMPYKTAKDIVAAVFEKALPKAQRTKAIAQDFELLAWAKNDVKSEDVQNALKYSAKLGDDVTSAQFAENRKIFDSNALDAVRKFVEKVPQAGDMLFKNGYYAKSLAGFLKARGYDAEAVYNGKVSDAVLAEARGYAIQEAMKATFNDCNAFSDAFAGIGRKNTDNPWAKALNVAAEGILPFRRTPANIVVRFAEYSPLGLTKGAWDMATKVRNGELSASAAIDQISSGMAGTAVMALGYFLAQGIGGVKITGSGTDEDERRQGHQDYALEFSIDGQEYSYKIDWAAPANLPLFVGANIHKMLEDAGAETDVSTFTSILHGMGTMFEPMLALSCMSSLNDLVEGIRYAPEGEALYSAAADIATSYFTQGIPALARQAYQARQTVKQTTFANSDDPTIRDVQKLGANIPFVGAAFQTDKVNAWGEAESTGNTFQRYFNAFINPGTFKAIDNGALEQEITRLNEAQSVNVSPPTVEKTISYTDSSGAQHDDMRLTEEQYQKLATVQGQTAKKLLDQIISSADYKALTDDQKAQTINAVYEYAREQGKKAALEDYHSKADAWIRNAAEGDISTFINRGALSPLERAVENTVNALTNGWTVTEAAKKEMDETYAAYDKMSDEAKRQILENAVGDVAKYLEIRSGGVDTDSYLDAVEDVKALQPEEGYTSIRDIQRREAIANSGLSPESIDVIMKAYMTDYDPEDESPDKTELRYDYARQELGLSPAEYAEVYRVQADGGKKADKIAAWVSMGYTQQEATILYNLFAATGKSKIDVESWNNAQ